MVLIVIALFNSLRLPLIIWLTVPLSLIGVTAGLLIFNQPFGFMARQPWGKARRASPPETNGLRLASGGYAPHPLLEGSGTLPSPKWAGESGAYPGRSEERLSGRGPPGRQGRLLPGSPQP